MQPQGDEVQRRQAKQIVSRCSAVFTAPPRRTPYDFAVDGPLLGNGDIGVALAGPPEQTCFWLSKNDFWKRVGKFGTSSKVIGAIQLCMPCLTGSNHRVTQQFWEATTTACFERENWAVTMRSWVAATANLLVVELSASSQDLELEVRLYPRMEEGADSEKGTTDDVHWFVKKYVRNVTVPTEVACAARLIGSESLRLQISPGVPVTLVCAIQSRCKSERYHQEAIELARGLGTDGLQKLRESHVAWWKRFWEESWVEIGDPVLEQRYYLSHYVMASACRDLEYPPGIFGIWVTTNNPRWAGDYHLNYNHEAPYYGLYSSNHLEQAAVYHQPILDFMGRGKWYARENYHCRGVHYPVCIGPKSEEVCLERPYDSYATPDQYEHGGLFYGQKSNASYCAVDMALHWYHTYEEEYAKTVYPFIREVASFWEDYLRLEADRYVIYEDAIHERSGSDFNPILSLGLVRMVFRLALDISRTLGIDGGRHAKWEHILGHVSEYPTYTRDGKAIFRLSERGLDWGKSNTLAIQHIYPAGGIGLDSDREILSIARNTIDALRRWRDQNGMSSFYPAAVRVGYDPQTILQHLREMVNDIGAPNGFIEGNPHGIENCSVVPNTINEMLVQGHEGILRLFPVWPADHDARFWNLRVEGAFLLAAEQKEGLARNVQIVSTKGRDCTIQNPWPGSQVAISRDGRIAEQVEGERFTLHTRAGETITISQCNSASH